MSCEMRSRADRLQAEKGAHLRRQRTLAESREDERVVVRAVVRAQAGDREALRFLYLRYANNVYGYIRSIVHDDFEAEDITQAVFVKLMSAITKYELRSVPFSRWILRLAHNAAVDYLRVNRPVLCDEVRRVDLEADDTLSRVQSLHEALAELSSEQRNVIVLRHLVGLSPGEIAAELGRSESSIHGLHFRARATMRSQLSALGSAPTTVAVAS